MIDMMDCRDRGDLGQLNRVPRISDNDLESFALACADRWTCMHPVYMYMQVDPCPDLEYLPAHPRDILPSMGGTTRPNVLEELYAAAQKDDVVGRLGALGDACPCFHAADRRARSVQRDGGEDVPTPPLHACHVQAANCNTIQY
jgi:hypothetical protein